MKKMIPCSALPALLVLCVFAQNRSESCGKSASLSATEVGHTLVVYRADKTELVRVDVDSSAMYDSETGERSLAILVRIGASQGASVECSKPQSKVVKGSAVRLLGELREKEMALKIWGTFAYPYEPIAVKCSPAGQMRIWLNTGSDDTGKPIKYGSLFFERMAGSNKELYEVELNEQMTYRFSIVEGDAIIR